MSAVAEYRRVCQKGDQENYLFDKYVFRPFSIYVTIVFIKLGIGANYTTFLSLLAALGSLWLLLGNHPGSMLGAAGFIFFYHLLDHVDGELARYYIGRGEQEPSLAGQYFDVLVHSFSANLMLLFMSLGLFQLYGEGWIVVVGIVAAWGASGFPRLVASQVLLQKIARDHTAPSDHPGVARALQVLEWKGSQVAAVHDRGLTASKLKKLGIEIAGYPGTLYLLIGALALDAILPELGSWVALDRIGTALLGLEPNVRLLLLKAVAFLGLVKIIYLTMQMSRLLRPIA